MDLCYELELEGELVPQGATASQILTPRGLTDILENYAQVVEEQLLPVLAGYRASQPELPGRGNCQILTGIITSGYARPQAEAALEPRAVRLCARLIVVSRIRT